MPIIKFVQSDGTTVELDAPVGKSVMNVAVDNGVPGIDGDCGGMAICATCHVYVGETWLSVLQPPDENEQELLQLAENVRPNSRLGCQLEMNQELDGLTVHVPAA